MEFSAGGLSGGDSDDFDTGSTAAGAAAVDAPNQDVQNPPVGEVAGSTEVWFELGASSGSATSAAAAVDKYC